MERVVDKKQSGQILVESAVATGIIVILVVSVVTLSLRALNQNRLVSDQTVATNLAIEGYEVAKNILDGNVYRNKPWNEGFDLGKYEVDYKSLNLGESLGDNGEGRYLKKFYDLNTETTHYGYSEGGDTIFKRVIEITSSGSPLNQINITSTVSWPTPKNPQGETVSVSGALLGWR
jgi:hypothetical protein